MMKSKTFYIIGLAVFACFLLIIYYFSEVIGIKKERRIVGDPIEFVDASKEGKRLTLGFIPQGNALLMVHKWKPLADYLEKELNMPTDLVYRTSYEEIIHALMKDEIDVCLTGAYVYVLARQVADIQPIVRRKKKGSPYYHSLIIARKERGFKTIKELRGKSFAFIDKHSTSGYLLPALMLRKNGISDFSRFFSTIIYTHNHDSAVLAVQKKQIEAAVISSTRWTLDSPLPNEVEIIWKSKPILLGPFSVRGKLDAALIEKIRTAFLKIGKDPKTIALSRHINVEAFEKAEDKDYNALREIIDEYSEF